MSLATTQDAIVLFGDSITQAGWDTGAFAQKLAYVYARRMDVINRGFGGYNTEWAIPVFKQIFAKKEHQQSLPKCKLLTIWFGANDSVFPGKLQYIPLDRFKKNLTWMIESLRDPTSEYYAPWTRVILITPPPIQVSKRARELASRNPPQEIDRSHENTKTYVEATKELSASLKVPLVNVWDAIWSVAKEDQNLGQFLSDGLHLTSAGYEIVYKELINVISKEYPELHYDRLPQVFPSWDAVDPNDPAASVVSQYIDV